MHERWAVELLLAEAYSFYAEGRFAATLRATGAALEAARVLGDVELRVRALVYEGGALKILGEFATALARHTEVLALAEDPAHREALAGERAQRAVAESFLEWVGCARSLPEFSATDLLTVLDRAEAWLRGVGRGRWRAGVCSQRAQVLAMLGRRPEALGLAEEAVALAERNPTAPGYTLAGYRLGLGDLLRGDGQTERAAGQYQRVLDDPASARWDRFVALVGLAWCALARGEPPRAQELAADAVRLAEGLGENALCQALEVAVAAHRGASDLPSARAAAERHLQLARCLGAYRQYFAVRVRLDVALDEGDRGTAGALLVELQPLAEALDGATGRREERDAYETRRRRLAELPE